MSNNSYAPAGRVYKSAEFAMNWWRNVCLFVITGVVIANLIVVSTIGVGAYMGSGMMEETSKSTIGMRQDTLQLRENATRYVSYLMESYPKDYDRTVVAQVLNTVSNVDQISARANVLLNSITPDMIGEMITQIDAITGRVHAIVQATDKDQMADLINRVVGVLASVDDILDGVSGDDVGQAVHVFNQLANHVTHVIENAESVSLIDKITTLVENTNAIEQRIREMHELRVQLP